MFGPLQSRDNEFRHWEGIQRPKDGRRHLLQTALKGTQVENRILHQLAWVPTSQVRLVSVCQHMRPARNRNKGRRTTHCSHNRPEHRYLVCSIDCEASSEIKSSPNGCSWSRTTRGPFSMLSLCRSSSPAVNGFPWKSSTRHPGVSRCKRWSRAKWRRPW